MVVYNFKQITPVLGAMEFIDAVLTKTQRGTPTVIRAGYSITRIREFYMRKLRFCAQQIGDRLANMLSQFPRLDDIHPFYADLMNVLYDRDHYKLALGQVNAVRNLALKVCRDYVQLVKYGDSLYRCKSLKRAGLGRMCTLIKKLKASFGYLEEVRKHLSRLPALDPSTRTLLLTGYPNVGKSSFMNKVTRADVDVQPYAFTTKALYVGHMDYRYLRWQVVDTPGILDHPLEERNTIEMQAVTALAHLQCAVLYFFDVSEQCGYTLDEQIRLFENIRPLFANKQLVLVLNKVDVMPIEQIDPSLRERIDALARETNATVLPMSNVSEHNISEVRNTACDALVEARVEAKERSGRAAAVLGRITVAMPKPRDNKKREAYIPESVIAARRGQASMTTEDGADGDSDTAAAAAAAAAVTGAAAPSQTRGSRAVGGRGLGQTGGVTERDRMWQNGGPGVYACDWRKYYLLEEDEWRFDRLPEIMDGKNVADYDDPHLEEKLQKLEEEEVVQEEEEEQRRREDEEHSDLDDEERVLVSAIRDRKTIMREESRLNKNQNHSHLPRTARPVDLKAAVEHLDSVGVATEGMERRGRTGRKRTRSLSRARGDEDEDDDDGTGEGKMETVVPRGGDDSGDDDGDGRGRSRVAKRRRDASRARSASRSRGPPESKVRDLGLQNPTLKSAARKIAKKSQKSLQTDARAGEGDRRQSQKLLKHRLAGKMGKGTRRNR